MSGLIDQSADAQSKTIGQNFRVRAYIRFDGTGTIAIKSSGNVSTISDEGTGAYQINFYQPMNDNNYSAVMYHNGQGGSNWNQFNNSVLGGLGQRTNGSIRLTAHNGSGNADSELCDIIIVG